MKRLSVIFFAGLLAFAGCSDDEDSGGGDDNSANGCVQGVIINGLTGDRLDLAAASDTSGLFVLVQGSLKAYTPLTTDPAAPNMQRGEYTLCGVPLDETFPVMGWFDGFAPYETTLTVDSTRAARSGNAEYDLVKPVPTKILNIAVFPKETAAKDLTVNLHLLF